MKRYVLMAVTSMFAMLLAGVVVGQESDLRVRKAGFVQNADGSVMYSAPSTRIIVDITVRTESVKIGPYARFAQNCLGVIAPLSDKVNSEIVDVKLSYVESGSAPAPLAQLPEMTQQAISLTRSQDDFVKVLPDRLSSMDKSADMMAREAANTIFSIRKNRMELITAQAGENVFGAGLKVALDELERLENEYLALFLGKTTVTTQSYRFEVVPERSKTAYVVCRFAEDNGILPQSDVSGQPVMLEVKPDGRYDSIVPFVDPKEASRISYEKFHVASNAACRVMSGTNVLAEKVIPVFQMGDLYDINRETLPTELRTK